VHQSKYLIKGKIKQKRKYIFLNLLEQKCFTFLSTPLIIGGRGGRNSFGLAYYCFYCYYYYKWFYAIPFFSESLLALTLTYAFKIVLHSSLEHKSKQVLPDKSGTLFYILHTTQHQLSCSYVHKSV